MQLKQQGSLRYKNALTSTLIYNEDKSGAFVWN